jgi:ABC-type iron transport system FetAB permease component
MANIEYSQKFLITPPKQTHMFPITESEWMRLKKLISRKTPTIKLISYLPSLFLGIFSSSIFSIISLFTIENKPSWVFPTNVVICVSSLILGAGFISIDILQKKIANNSSNDIIDEMNNIEKQYEEIRQ